jgi:hypothetical protein
MIKLHKEEIDEELYTRDDRMASRKKKMKMMKMMTTKQRGSASMRRN